MRVEIDSSTTSGARKVVLGKEGRKQWKTVREWMGCTNCIMYESSRALLHKYVVQRVK